MICLVLKICATFLVCFWTLMPSVMGELRPRGEVAAALSCTICIVGIWWR